MNEVCWMCAFGLLCDGGNFERKLYFTSWFIVTIRFCFYLISFLYITLSCLSCGYVDVCSNKCVTVYHKNRKNI